MAEHEIDFGDLTPIEIPFTVNGKRYFLVEAGSEASAKYLDAIVANTRIEDGKPVGLKGFASHQLSFLAACIYLSDDKGNRTELLVDRPTVYSWPARVTKQLFEKLEAISEVAKIDEERVGNAPSGTTDGSA
jgi:catechol-2,3-dioxygenase